MELPFTPMLLSRAPSAFADAGWVYQVKWDGVRNVALVGGGVVRHWSRRLRDRTHLFPEFAGLAALFGTRRAVLDGEIIVLRGGKPSFAGILERDTAGRPDQRKVRTLPATFMVFDLLEYGERALYRAPLEERLKLLEEVLVPGETWQTVASFPGEQGPDLFRAVADKDLEGVVAKRLGSGYQPGVRSRDWVKVKRRRRMLAVICGYTAPEGRPGGLLLGAYREGRLVYIGRAGSGIAAADLTLLRTHLAPGPRPFTYEPVLRDRFAGNPGPVVWTAPRVTVEVEFSEWTEEQRLRDPVVVGFSQEPASAAIIE